MVIGISVANKLSCKVSGVECDHFFNSQNVWVCSEKVAICIGGWIFQTFLCYMYNFPEPGKLQLYVVLWCPLRKCHPVILSGLSISSSHYIVFLKQSFLFNRLEAILIEGLFWQSFGKLKRQVGCYQDFILMLCYTLYDAQLNKKKLRSVCLNCQHFHVILLRDVVRERPRFTVEVYHS